MDDIDQQLLQFLREDARMSVLMLAKKLRLSRTTVQKRLTKLESAGVILAYTIKTRADVLQHKIRAMMNIAIEGNFANAVQQALRALPEVYSLHTTNGKWDVIAEIRAENLEVLNLILGKIRTIEGIAGSETNILLSTLKI
nr:Lrp/AsnC family transcriptional regulator [uncultured Undibacterium sp.]